MRLRISPPLALFLLSPAIGELLSGSSPPLEYFKPVTLILLAGMYGCGALICRELIVRWNKSWLSLLLLGMAYGIYEEGLVVRSFFSPSWEDLNALGQYGRVNGVNWIWAEHLTHYHALISIMASVVLVEVMYPHTRGERWLGRRGWIVCLGALALWLPLGIAAFPYDAMPVGYYLLTMGVIAVLVWSARVIPSRIFSPIPRSVPRPRRFGILGFAGLFVYFFTVYAMSDNQTVPYGVTMIVLILLDLLVFGLVLRWSGNGASWDDRHRLALVAGGLSFFIFFDVILESQGVLGMSVVGFVAAFALRRLGRRINRRIQQAEAAALPASA